MRRSVSALAAILIVTIPACGGRGPSAARPPDIASPASTQPGTRTPGPDPAQGGREPGPTPADAPPPMAGRPAGRAPMPSPSTSQPRPAVQSVTSASTEDDPVRSPVHDGSHRSNLGGDHHPIIPQQPFGSIEIPSIGLDHPIYEGVELPTLRWGPGHWPGTAMPGESGNAVFAGHRVTHTRPFLDIDQLQPGDQIILATAAGRFVYEVTGHQIVTADDVHIADPTLTPTVTLMACHPKGSARQRYVVRGRLVG